MEIIYWIIVISIVGLIPILFAVGVRGWLDELTGRERRTLIKRKSPADIVLEKYRR